MSLGPSGDRTTRSSARWRGRAACCPTRARSASSSTTTRCTPSSTCRSTRACRPARDALGARPYLSLREFRAALQLRTHRATTTCGTRSTRALGERAPSRVLPGLTRRSALARAAACRLRHRRCGRARVHAFDAGIAAAMPRTCRCGTRASRASRRGPRLAPARPAAGPPASRRAGGARRRRHRRGRARRADPAGRRLPGPGAGARHAAGPRARLPAGGHRALCAMARRRRATAAAPSATCARRSTDQTSARDVIDRGARGASACDGDDVEPFLFATALALPGWAGMFSRLERHPEDHRGGPPTSLAEFLAVRLLLERRAVERACRAQASTSDWTRLRGRACRRRRRSAGARRRRCCGAWPRPPAWSPDRVAALDDDALGALWARVRGLSATSSGARSSRKPTSAPTGARSSTRWRRAAPCRTRRRAERPARAVRVLHRRARGVDPPRDRGAAPRLHHLRRGRASSAWPSTTRASTTASRRRTARSSSRRRTRCTSSRSTPTWAGTRCAQRLRDRWHALERRSGGRLAHAERRRRHVVPARPGLGRARPLRA